MERLDFSEKTAYNATEACIHLNRYAFARPFCQDARILDAACGEGYGSYLMKTWGAKEVVGVDIDKNTVELAANLFQAEGLTYQAHTVEELPFADASFDMVVSFETIEHVDRPEAFLAEIKRVLKPGGRVVMSCPNDNYYYENDTEKNPFHKREYSFFQFKELAERYLGTDAAYYFGFAMDGFINLPEEKCTEPETAPKLSMLDMLHYQSMDSALCVPQQFYTNKWNAAYYIGIWGGSGDCYRLSTAIAPRPVFMTHKDEDYDLLGHATKVKQECDTLHTALTMAYGNLDSVTQRLEAMTLQKTETEAALVSMEQQRDGLAKDLSAAQEQLDDAHMAYSQLTNHLTLAQQERDQAIRTKEAFENTESKLAEERDALLRCQAELKQQLAGECMARSRLTDLLTLTKTERDQAIRTNEALQNTEAKLTEERDALLRRQTELEQQLAGECMARSRLTDLLALTKAERDQAWQSVTASQADLAMVQGERDWLRGRWESRILIRIKRFLTRVVRKIRG